MSSFILSLLGFLEFPAPGVKTDHLPQMEMVGVRLWALGASRKISWRKCATYWAGVGFEGDVDSV